MGQGRPRGLLGRAGRSRCTGSSRGTRCSTGTSRTRSGSSAARSTPATTASTGTWPDRARTRPRSSGRASRATRRVLTYQELHREVCKFANVLKALGVQKGDRVTIYMPMVPEAAIAMLACARIGATHSVVFGGFSRRGRRRPQQRRQGEARHHRRRRLAARQGRAAQGERRRGAGEVADGREVHRLQPLQHSGRHEGRPRRLVARADGRRLAPTAPPSRSTASTRCSSSTPPARPASRRACCTRPAATCSASSLTHKWVFDLKEDDIYWCTADVGWVTGHSYIVYGPLANGATVVMYEGAPEPSAARIASGRSSRSTGSTIFYTAPTAIRAFIKWGDQWPKGHDLSSLRLLGTRRRADQPRSVDVVSRGHRRRPLPDRRYLVADRNRRDHDLAAARRHRRPSPASATRPLPGIVAEVVDKQGNAVPREPGRVPGHQAAVAGDAADDLRRRRALQAARTGARCPACYFTADGARQDEDGYFWVMGRVDDVLNVAGHRLSTMEVESALVHHPKVAEAAVVGQPDDIKGEGIVCFVTLKQGVAPTRRAEEGAARRTSSRRSARWPGRTRSASPTRCRRRARARSCGGCCATSPPAGRRPATRRRWRTTACWRSCARKRSEVARLEAVVNPRRKP